MIPVVQPLLNKISQKSLEQIVGSTENEEMKNFLTNQYFVVTLENNLSKKPGKSYKNKI